MATIAFTEVLSEGKTRVFKWETVTEADQPASLGPTELGWGHFSDITIVMIGTPGGATIALQGSHDNTTWVPIFDPGGTAISLSASGTYNAARDSFPYLRPQRTGGTGADMDITLAVTRAP